MRIMLPDNQCETEEGRKAVATLIARTINEEERPDIPYQPEDDSFSFFWIVDAGNDWRVRFFRGIPDELEIVHRLGENEELRQVGLVGWIAHRLNGKIEDAPLPLYDGARPCVQCGWCCKKTPCGFGKMDESTKQCAELVDKHDGTYDCRIYWEIIRGKDTSWKFSPAFGAGCCAGLNSDRHDLLERRKT